MRVFYAIEFQPKMKDYLSSLQMHLKNYCIKGNFSCKENFHLTLKFIGEVDRYSLKKVKESLDYVACINNSFNLKLDNIGEFKREQKSIVWIGIKQLDNSLQLLYNSLEDNLALRGFKRENRKYRPHITLSRETIFKENCNPLNEILIDHLDIEVKQISIMESSTINNKLTYTPIYVKNLL